MDTQNKYILPQIPSKNNFDFLRLIFAISVLCNHYSILTEQNWILPISSPMALSGFFIISGFLIVRSYYRSHSFKTYLEKRARRILPAYVCVVLLSAFGLFFLSPCSVEDYFLSSVFGRYLIANLSFLNFLQPSLPGVFIANPEIAVNPSLWTIKVEIALYLFVPVIVFLICRYNQKIVLFLIYLFAILFNRGMDYLYNLTGNPLYEVFSKQVFFQLAFFITGVLLFLYFDFFQKNRLVLFLIVIPILFFKTTEFLSFFFPLAWGLIIFFVAFSFSFLNKIGKYGDFSYGIYLFHCPIIQVLISLNVVKYNNNLAFLLVILITFILAFLSWNLVEKKFLGQRK